MRSAQLLLNGRAEDRRQVDEGILRCRRALDQYQVLDTTAWQELPGVRHLPEGDLIAMLSPVERLRFRPEALDDLEWDGLIQARVSGDERMVSITEAGEAWLRSNHQPTGEVDA